jgi:MFS family permease
VAVAYQTYRLTGSTAMVGLVSLSGLAPLLAGSVLGGPVVDAWDRRKVLLVTQVLLAVGAAGLAINAPDAMQGRVNSLVFAGLQGGPRLGDAEAGAVADLAGPRVAAWSGGLLSVATAVITCWAIPQFWRYQSTAVAGPAARSVRPASGPGQPAGDAGAAGQGTGGPGAARQS